MNVTKHKVHWVINDHIAHVRYFASEERAREYVGNDPHLVYVGAVEVNMRCENCSKDLEPGDDYIKVDEHQRYCDNCYEEQTTIIYSVDGEYVGDGNSIAVYDDWDREEY